MTINETMLLSCIEIAPPQPAKKTMIILHGLGADGNDFVPIVSMLQLPDTMGIRFVFPHAPVMPVTINNGFEMRAWYDIASFALDSKVDKAGIDRSVSLVEELIEKETKRGIASTDIALAGFSQGAAIALTTGISYSQPLAGVISLSGYLPLAHSTFEKASTANRRLPLFMGHGTDDPIVPYSLGKTTYLTLKQAGYPVSWHSYDKMPHSVCAEEINDIREWLAENNFLV